MYGVTEASFLRKSSKSTTRALRIGKLESGSTVTAPLWTSRRYVPHVSRGWPFTCAQQDPQMPTRHDQRIVRVGSMGSLMQFRQADTILSLWYGLVKSCDG